MGETNTEASGPDIRVTPNPATPGQEVTITGHCGPGGKIEYIGNRPGQTYPFDRGVRIVDENPNGFVAVGQIAENLGNGAGPVVVDCGARTAETLLVTHV